MTIIRDPLFVKLLKGRIMPDSRSMPIMIILSMGFCQFAVTTGALPATAATLAIQAAWTGGMPAFFLDNNNA